MAWRVYLTMAVFGITSLTPWNTVITAYDFFRAEFNGTHSRRVVVDFPSYFQIGGITSDLVVSLMCLAWLKPVHLKQAITASNGICLALFVLLTSLARVDTSSWAWEYFVIAISSFCVVCASSTFYKAAMMSTAAMTGSHAVQGFIFGQGGAGALAAVLSIITLSFPVPDPIAAGFWYFLFATVFLGSALGLYLWYVSGTNGVRSTEERQPENTLEEATRKPEFTVQDELEETGETLDEENNPLLQKNKKASTKAVFKKIWRFSGATFVTLLVTMSCFPAPLSTLQSTAYNQDSDWAKTYFKAVGVFLVFNFGEVVGCITATFLHYPKSSHILLASCTRVLFIPLIFMCNLQPRTLPVWFAHDAWPTLFSFLLGWSEAQLLSLAAVYAPLAVSTPDEKSLCGNFQAVANSVGLLAGSVMVFPFLALMRL